VTLGQDRGGGGGEKKGLRKDRWRGFWGAALLPEGREKPNPRGGQIPGAVQVEGTGRKPGFRERGGGGKKGMLNLVAEKSGPTKRKTGAGKLKKHKRVGWCSGRNRDCS